MFHGEISQELQNRAEQEFPKGDSIDIYYDPEKPSEAVLITGIVPTTYWQLLFVVFIVAAYVYFIFTKERRKKIKARLPVEEVDSP